MTSTRLPQLGSMVWAELEDANGFRKVRPAVVVTATADIIAGRTVRVAAITTRLPNPLPADHVLLPWDPQGKARSGLRRKCAAVATWLAEILVGDVQQSGRRFARGSDRRVAVQGRRDVAAANRPANRRG